HPASNSLAFTRCICATCSSSVPGGEKVGASSSWRASSHAVSSDRNSAMSIGLVSRRREMAFSCTVTPLPRRNQRGAAEHMKEASTTRVRVVQCGTGNIGRRALREVIRHPELELAGVQVYDPAKEGVDAGMLCGEEPVGVVATRDGTAIRAL